MNEAVSSDPVLACADARARFQPSTREAPATWRAQFGRPSGLAGWFVGHLMAVKNAGRSRWVIDRLELAAGQRALEIGFGPGADLARTLELVGSTGVVAGVDHSGEMLRHARARNAAAVAEGRADLRLGSACALPFDDRSFDRVLSINAVQFWEDRVVGLCEVRRVLAPGGVAAIAIQPRNAGATAADSERWARTLVGEMREVGFVDVRAEQDDAAVPTVLVLGTRR